MNELTREQILEMTTEELSLAVAERVFKARIIGNSDDPEARLLVGEFGGVNAVRPLSGERWQRAIWRNSDEKAWLDCPRYAEDIAAAWEVEEHFNQDSEIRSDYMIKLYVIVGLQPHLKPSLDDLYLIAHATAEQRCKAALLAVMDL